MKKEYPTKQFLDSILNYNKETGYFTWKVRPVNSFKSNSYNVAKRWNDRYSNKTPVALGVDILILG